MPERTQDARLADLVRLQVKAEEDLEDAELRLKDAKKRLRALSEERIPDAMAALGFEVVKLPDGTKVDIGEQIRASIPKHLREEVHTALEEGGHGDVVKRRIFVDVGLDREMEGAAYDALDCAGLHAQHEAKVEPSTLSSLVREILADGDEVPEGIKIFRQRSARITQSRSPLT